MYTSRKVKSATDFIVLLNDIIDLYDKNKSLYLKGILIELRVPRRNYYEYISRYSKNKIVSELLEVVGDYQSNSIDLEPNPIRQIFYKKVNDNAIEYEALKKLELEERALDIKQQALDNEIRKSELLEELQDELNKVER